MAILLLHPPGCGDPQRFGGGRGSKGRQGRQLSDATKVQFNGTLLVAKAYTARSDVGHEDSHCSAVSETIGSGCSIPLATPAMPLQIRPYKDDDWPAVWALLEPVFRAGETFTAQPGLLRRQRGSPGSHCGACWVIKSRLGVPEQTPADTRPGC